MAFLREEYAFSAMDVVTMLSAVETSIRDTEKFLAQLEPGELDKESLARFDNMLYRRRAVLSKVKNYMREMDALPEGYE